MPLNKSKGQMYDWVTHTYSHLGGECDADEIDLDSTATCQTYQPKVN